VLTALFFAFVPTIASSGSFDPVTATEALLATVPAAMRAKSGAYTESGHWVLIGTFFYGALMKYGLLQTGLSARIRDIAGKIGWGRWSQNFLYGVFYVSAMAVLFLPWQFGADFWRPHYFGMSNQTFSDWIRDQSGGLIQDLLFVPVLASAIYGFLALSSQRWHIFASALGIAVFAVKLVIAPLYLTPLFFTFTPLEAGEVRDQIQSLARANQVPANEIYRFNLSKVTSFPNAQVDGIGPTARIALSDNLVDHGTMPEIRLIFGHEMGHYVLGHSFIMLIENGVMICLLFSGLSWAYPALLARARPLWQINGPADIASMPVLMFLILLFRLLVDPIDSAITRVAEQQADIFAINATHEVDALSTLVLKIAQRDKLAPGPVEEFLFFDHPSARNRILAAMRWKAENLPKE
jgi:STE24 endopeptidase